jgi:hypothetical protein
MGVITCRCAEFCGGPHLGDSRKPGTCRPFRFRRRWPRSNPRTATHPSFLARPSSIWRSKQVEETLMQNFWDTVPGFLIAIVSCLVGGIIGTAYGPLLNKNPTFVHIRMTEALAAAERATNWNVGARLRRYLGPSTAVRDSESERDTYILAGLAALVALGLYTKYTELVAVVIVSAALVALVGTTWTFVTLWLRNVVDGGSVAHRLILIFILGGIGILNGTQLINPFFTPGALKEVRAHGVFGAAGSSGPAIALQLVGALATFIVLFAAIMFCLASTTSVYVFVKAPGAWLWKVLFWTGRWSTGKYLWIAAVLIGVMSLGLSSGGFAELVAHAQSQPRANP